jgi:hypothetical protein
VVTGDVGAAKSALSPTLSLKERGLFGVGREFGVILKLLTLPIIPANAGTQ